ncbi:hypothetical protein 3 [Zizania latifolia tombusvirus]|nr:hypothetical protein 3 [Zizania latifolia tombusvirus]
MAKKSQGKNAAKAISRKKSSSAQTSKARQVVVRAPQSMSIRSSTPRSGEIRVEMVMEVRSGFNSFVLHPDNIHWLRGVAPSYQQWQLSNIKMWYEPRVATSTNGQVSMAFLEDFEDDTQSIRSLEGLTRISGACRGAPWDKLTLNPPRSKSINYVNLTKFNAMSGTDKNDRALGQLLAFADMDDSFPSSSVVGRVYLQYVPQLKGATDPATQA